MPPTGRYKPAVPVERALKILEEVRARRMNSIRSCSGFFWKRKCTSELPSDFSHEFKLNRAGLLAAAFLAAIFGGAPNARAQSPEAAQIVLPTRLIAGQPATLAVLDKFGRLVPKTNLSLSDGTPIETDATGRAFFNAPATPGVLIARRCGASRNRRGLGDSSRFPKSDKTRIDWAPTQVFDSRSL